MSHGAQTICPIPNFYHMHLLVLLNTAPKVERQTSIILHLDPFLNQLGKHFYIMLPPQLNNWRLTIPSHFPVIRQAQNRALPCPNGQVAFCDTRHPPAHPAIGEVILPANPHSSPDADCAVVASLGKGLLYAGQNAQGWKLKRTWVLLDQCSLDALMSATAQTSMNINRFTK